MACEVYSGRLTLVETDVLIEYFMRVREINRGLERAGAAHAALPSSGRSYLVGEFERNQAKADEVLNEALPRYGDEPLINATERALYRVEVLYSLQRRGPSHSILSGRRFSIASPAPAQATPRE
jgi:hypothetical protein